MNVNGDVESVEVAIPPALEQDSEEGRPRHTWNERNNVQASIPPSQQGQLKQVTSTRQGTPVVFKVRFHAAIVRRSNSSPIELASFHLRSLRDPFSRAYGSCAQQSGHQAVPKNDVCLQKCTHPVI
jgi:hypothetical protein